MLAERKISDTKEMNEMFCGKCKWWSGLLIFGECMWQESPMFGKSTISSKQCRGNIKLKDEQDSSKIDESCRPTVEQLQEEQSSLVEDLVHKANLLRITEKALEDIRAICISSMYWKNDEYPSCARILAHHHKIVIDAQVKIAELTAIEYGDTVEVEHS